ncbi:hypothetical protein SJ993_13645, partial [Enterococcus faecium]
IGNPSLNHRYRKGFYSLFKTLQQNRLKHADVQTTLGTYGHLYLNSLREITNDPTDYIQTNFSKIKPTPIYDNKK